MIDSAWDEYRAWAGRARELQAASRRWNLAAFSCAAVAAVLGAAAGQASGSAATILSALAAVAAAVTPVLGRDILSVRREAGWIRARAVAEAIKAECFRFAARAGPYTEPPAPKLFIERRELLSRPALQANLQPLPITQSEKPDLRRPPVPLDAEWYLQHRLDDQTRWYARAQARHARVASLLRICSLALALVGTALGALGSYLGNTALAPWIGVATTFGGLLVAYGLSDRHEYLAASYSAMQTALGHIRDRFNYGELGFPDLVEETERLLEGEHAAWADRMAKSVPQPLKQAPGAKNELTNG